LLRVIVRLVGWLVFCVGSFILAGVMNGASSNVAKAEELYRTTQYEAALALLDKHSSDPSELDLIGRIYLMMGDFHQATDFLSKALDADPKNSQYADWLGRAWGRRAESANALSAAGYASKTRERFEQAVQLDPKNKEALSDLFDYYVQAPGIMGGGIDKATNVAQQMAALDPAEGYAMKAKIAEKRKDYSNAEQAFRQAVETEPKQAGHRVELAQFLARQGRAEESDAAFQKIEHDFPSVPSVWFAHAQVLVRQNRRLAEAKRLLEKYRETPLTADDPPKRDAEKLLARASSGG
jgi:tetratricopeptide (TPR) repeat protein